jgi:hypothetical protein
VLHLLIIPRFYKLLFVLVSLLDTYACDNLEGGNEARVRLASLLGPTSRDGYYLLPSSLELLLLASSSPWFRAHVFAPIHDR